MSLPNRITIGLVAAAFCFVPLAANAGAIPAKTLDEHRRACETRCAPDASEAYCERMCSCVTDRMDTQWDEKDYRIRHKLMSDDPENDQVRSELEQFVLYCKGRLEPDSE